MPEPMPMSEPFKWKEIYEASLKLNINKSPDNNGLQAEHIDAFHRQLLRQLLNIHYPNIITNTDIYAMTRQHLWTYKINQNKLRFTGHILRLPEPNSSQTSITNCIKTSYKTKKMTKNHMDTIYEHLTPIGWSRQTWY